MASATKDKSSEDWSWLTWPLFVLILWGPCRDAWYSKFRYSIQYQIPSSKIVKENEPHDCDFLKAPIGNKVCHYEIRVSTVRTAFDTHGKPIISFDEGLKWFSSEEPERPYAEVPIRPVVSTVSLTWEKVEDE